MKSFELLARRYCAFLGEDPDEILEGLPMWKIALTDLEAAITALEMFGVEARGPMSEDEVELESDKEPRRSSSDNIRPFRRVA